MTSQEKIDLITKAGFTPNYSLNYDLDLTDEQKEIVNDLEEEADSSPYKRSSIEYQTLYRKARDKEAEFVEQNRQAIESLGEHESVGETLIYDGAEVEVCVHFIDLDIIVKSTGWYASYEGYGDMTPWREAKPVEKVITVYEYI